MTAAEIDGKRSTLDSGRVVETTRVPIWSVGYALLRADVPDGVARAFLSVQVL